jgi:hypothetical protein
MTTAAHRICPRHEVIVLQPAAVELELELEPLAQTHRGFETRLPPVTEADHVAVGLAVNAKKDTPDWDGLTVHFAHCEEVQRSGGRP